MIRSFFHPLRTFFFFALLSSWAWAQGTASPTPSPRPAVLKPIEMTDHPLLGVLYQHEGVYLLQDRQFEELVNPLRDYEATRLLKNSESAGDIGRILHWVGGAALVVGATGLLTGSSDQQTTFWLTSAGGALTFNIGSFFEMGARSDRFNCVQRYNRFARGEEQVLPAAEDEKSLMDLGSMKPSGTPTPTSK